MDVLNLTNRITTNEVIIKRAADMTSNFIELFKKNSICHKMINSKNVFSAGDVYNLGMFCSLHSLSFSRKFIFIASYMVLQRFHIFTFLLRTIKMFLNLFRYFNN